MREPLESSKEDLDVWKAKWDKAVESGLFGTPKSIPSTSDSTAEFSFFGLRNDNHTEEIKDSDSVYWKAINSVADNDIEMQRLDEADAVSVDLPNPIRKSTEGKDQELEPFQLGLTYDEKDIYDLENLKLKLHDAESNSNSKSNDLEKIIKKIDDMSNRMCRPKK